MGTHEFDRMTKILTPGAPRRRVIQALGGLALGTLGIAARHTNAEASACHYRCIFVCRKKRKCLERCLQSC